MIEAREMRLVDAEDVQEAIRMVKDLSRNTGEYMLFFAAGANCVLNKLDLWPENKNVLTAGKQSQDNQNKPISL